MPPYLVPAHTENCGSRLAPAEVKVTQSVHAQSTVAAGVLGRLTDVLATQPNPYRTASYSVSGNAKILEGEHLQQSVLDGRSGVVRLENLPLLQRAMSNLSRPVSRSPFAEAYAALLDNSLASTESLGALLEPVALTAAFESDTLSRQLEQVAKVVSTRAALDEERQVFYVSLGGFDTHASELEAVHEKLAQVNGAIASFVDEMKAQGIWEQVTLLTASDFGRTLGSNGAGTDHAWGGHYAILGGSVNGGRIHGQYPSALDEHSDVNIGRNHRMLPTTPWEMIWYGIAEWFGADIDGSLDELLPNAANFGAYQRLTAAQLYK